MSAPRNATACIALADGTLIRGRGFGAEGIAVGELCFNTAMTGYQEIMTDPSYDGQIVTFTFPHIGNVGTNEEDEEAPQPHARGMIVRLDVTDPVNWRATAPLGEWMRRHGRIGVAGVDTRRLTRLIREQGMPHVAIAHAADGEIDTDDLVSSARAFAGLEGADLAKGVSTAQSYPWAETRWEWGEGFRPLGEVKAKVVAIDYGAKRNILRSLASAGCEVTVLPATATAAEVLERGPDGVFLSNGPGDPAATGAYAVPMISGVLEAGKPIFGICLGHQMLALALGGQTVKMKTGHHGANHPVKELASGKVEITSMNHGFAVDAASLPQGVVETHVSLFDRSNCGIALEGRPVFSVQQHPEASPGPQDSFYLFDRFVAAMA
ncbi:MAG: glutamine-hydrolyzing carbamoyl-phosphate synthase small subunit [Pseudomonadota bacterium]